MHKPWLISILCLSFILLSLLKAKEVSSLTPFFKAERTLKLSAFAKARAHVHPKDLELLELWESMLTGRSAPLSKWMKDRYKILGLNHIFTPSGFHLSAVLLPFVKFLKTSKQQLALLLLVAMGISFLPGFGALKRMVSVKIHQNIFGQRGGFILALLLDAMVGTFQNSALSFSYSFLFLGIIYSGLKGIGLIIWFFFAQMILMYFQGQSLFLLILFFSPLLNCLFTLAMPLLFLLSYPLQNWQLDLGIGILRLLQIAVDASATVTSMIPGMEVHIGLLVLVGFFLMKRWKHTMCLCFVVSSSLNLDLSRNPTVATWDFKPQGARIRCSTKGDEVVSVFEDGSCKAKLVRGMWWEKCSPRRRSNRRI